MTRSSFNRHTYFITRNFEVPVDSVEDASIDLIPKANRRRDHASRPCATSVSVRALNPHLRNGSGALFTTPLSERELQ